MSLTSFQRNLFRLPHEDIEFYGSKDIYEYFNIINRACEKPSAFYDPILDGEIIRSEPLEYKFYSQSFLYWGKSRIGRPTILVSLEKKENGTKFFIQPKAGITLWIVVAVFLFQLILFLFVNEFKKADSTLFIGSLAVILLVYFTERFHIRTVIDDFKNAIH